MRALLILALLAAPASAPLAWADENFAAWPLLRPDFPSTGGGGVMIRGYDPVVTGTTCFTRFQADEPDGTVHPNMVEFDALPTQGGTLCTNGRWRSEDGGATGTTPFRVFIKDGVRRGSS